MIMSRKGHCKYAYLGLGPMWVKVNGKQSSPFRLYRIWDNMKRRGRSHDKSTRKKPNYEVSYAHCTICEEWLDFGVFFVWAMSNGYRDDLTIDRIDNLKGYCPENCRWATHSEQNRNRRMTPKQLAACRRNAKLGGLANAARIRKLKGERA